VARLEELPAEPRRILHEARRAVLSTIDSYGRPHAVPVCYALGSEEIVAPIDAKPKSGEPLGRRRNLEANPSAALLVDRWDEDWKRLGWVMVRGVARFEPLGDAAALLVDRYPQYEEVPPGDDAIVITPERISWWTWS
jgi:PPOX class probable F420-dependent enzyme